MVITFCKLIYMYGGIRQTLAPFVVHCFFLYFLIVCKLADYIIISQFEKWGFMRVESIFSFTSKNIHALFN